DSRSSRSRSRTPAWCWCSATSIAVRSDRSPNGLSRNAAGVASRARPSVASSECAVAKITGTSLRSRMIRAAWIPSIVPWSWTSISTRSGASASACLNASSPVAAAPHTEYPSPPSMRSRSRAISPSSSTTRIRAPIARRMQQGQCHQKDQLCLRNPNGSGFTQAHRGDERLSGRLAPGLRRDRRVLRPARREGRHGPSRRSARQAGDEPERVRLQLLPHLPQPFGDLPLGVLLPLPPLHPPQQRVDDVVLPRREHVPELLLVVEPEGGGHLVGAFGQLLLLRCRRQLRLPGLGGHPVDEVRHRLPVEVRVVLDALVPEL